MSDTEEERRKSRNNCNNRSVGFAAAAIGVGVGVGAALYYLFNKHTDDPHGAGSSRRDEQFRQRSWTLEECSVCCDVMLKDQSLRALACSHRFHTACVEPWLADHGTCPNCRKAA